MIPYATIAEAEAVLGRTLTTTEKFWYNYSAKMPDHLIYHHNILFMFVVFTLIPLPFALIELWFPRTVAPYKIQPKVNLSSASFYKCYKDVLHVFVFVAVPLLLSSYPIIKMVGIRTGLPLPSLSEMAAQLAVYFLIEDYGNYWIHRVFLHGKWGYEKIHKVHHEFTAPIGFAGPYVHWAEMLIFAIPPFVGPAIVPGHMITYWLWIILCQVEAIEIHTGFNFPFSPTRFIPFYGGAEYHDYHHLGGQSQSNFASVFTYCDCIYGTDKGYRFHKAYLAKLKNLDDAKKV